MSLPRIIGITGYARHGKDTIAEVFVEEAGYQRAALADVMKKAMETLNPIVGVIEDALSPEVRLAEELVVGGWEGAKKVDEVRRLLQVFGTEVGRNMLGEDVWIQALAKSIPHFYSDHGPRVVIPDIRFLNEAAFIRRMRGEVYRVVRPDFDNGVGLGHASEREIASIYHDERFANDHDVEYLKNAVRRYIKAREEYVPPSRESLGLPKAGTPGAKYSTGEYAEFA